MQPDPVLRDPGTREREQSCSVQKPLVCLAYLAMLLTATACLHRLQHSTCAARRADAGGACEGGAANAFPWGGEVTSIHTAVDFAGGSARGERRAISALGPRGRSFGLTCEKVSIR